MKFRFTDEQEMLRRAARAYAQKELGSAYLRELDASGRAAHRELLPRMAALGFTALRVPAAHGGLGGGVIDAALLLEELGRSSLVAASILDCAIGFGSEAVRRLGSEAQQREMFPKVVRGDLSFAVCLGEPDAGLDGPAMRTRAVADGDTFVIDGARILTAGARESGCLMVAARSEPLTPGRGDLSLFAVDPQSPGIRYRMLETLGMHGAGGFCELDFDAVRVPRSALLGEQGGADAAVEAMTGQAGLFRAAYCIGCAQQAIDDALRYAGERQQFGQAIGKFQAIAHLLVDLQVEADAARWLLYRAAWTADAGAPCAGQTAMATLACSEALLRVTSDAMRVYGGYGLTMEFDIQRHFRDARLFVVADASSQVRCDRIAHAMGL